MNALVQIQAAVEAVKAAGVYPVAVDVDSGYLNTTLSNGEVFTIIPCITRGYTWEDVNPTDPKDIMDKIDITIRFQDMEANGTLSMLESMPKVKDSPRDYPNRMALKRRAEEGMETLIKRLLKLEERGLA